MMAKVHKATRKAMLVSGLALLFACGANRQPLPKDPPTVVRHVDLPVRMSKNHSGAGNTWAVRHIKATRRTAARAALLRYHAEEGTRQGSCGMAQEISLEKYR